eukprot:3109503-Pyramimonas_sp.AAC.1
MLRTVRAMLRTVRAMLRMVRDMLRTASEPIGVGSTARYCQHAHTQTHTQSVDGKGYAADGKGYAALRTARATPL